MRDTATHRNEAHRRRLRHRPALLGVLTVGVVAILSATGCAAGLNAETSRSRPSSEGVGSAVGTLTLRNVYVGGPAPAGGRAPVLLAMFNGGIEADRLLTIRSPAAASAVLPVALNLPPGGQQLVYTADRAPTLAGLRQPLQPGQSVQLTLVFDRHGELTMTVPVAQVAPDLLRVDGGAPAGR